jgi:penicillin-binding protein-related factor A (putative recombinase)
MAKDIGSVYENQFRKIMKDKYPLVIRVPDYKGTNTSGVAPGDFLCIKDGITEFYEVKHSYNKSSFPLSNIGDDQLYLLSKIFKEGKVQKVWFYIFMPRMKFKIHISDILSFIESNSRKSLPVSWLTLNNYITK